MKELEKRLKEKNIWRYDETLFSTKIKENDLKYEYLNDTDYAHEILGIYAQMIEEEDYQTNETSYEAWRLLTAAHNTTIVYNLPNPARIVLLKRGI